jgi:hypothetical protein
MDAHDTHCCIDHGCKYDDDYCPVAEGVRKQRAPCEHCDTTLEQMEYLDALWEHKNNPRELTDLEYTLAKMAEKYGRSNIIAILQEFWKLGIHPHSAISTLQTFRWIK